MMRSVLFSIFVLFISQSLYAEDGAKEYMSAEEFEASLHFKQGTIELPGGKAALNVPDGFRYLDPGDAQKVLEAAWGNPDGSGTLGMLFPSDIGPTHQNSWGVVITYDNDGHVSDEEADSIDYDDLLKDMQEAAEEASSERQKVGYGEIHLVGWAEKPSYDKASRKLFWAKELNFGEEANTLNYNVRVLGREGVLVLNAVADMSQLGSIREDMKDVIAFSNFTSGNQYADFDASTDRVAAYGLAALVGGTVAAKAGLFAKLGALLIAGKKFIVLIVIGIGAFLKSLFSRKSAN